MKATLVIAAELTDLDLTGKCRFANVELTGIVVDGVEHEPMMVQQMSARVAKGDWGFECAGMPLRIAIAAEEAAA